YRQASSGWRDELRDSPSVSAKDDKESGTRVTRPSNDARKIDPENRLLWHFPMRRLDAEQIRDSILAATGELQLDVGGPPVDTFKPRRSIYTKVMRNNRDPLL